MKEQGNTQRSLWKILIALLLLAAAFFGYRHFFPARVVTVGFIYDNDETAPYSYNFYLAQETVQKTYQDKVRTTSATWLPGIPISSSARRLSTRYPKKPRPITIRLKARYTRAGMPAA